MSEVKDSAIKLFGKTIYVPVKDAANTNELSSSAKACTFDHGDGVKNNPRADMHPGNSSPNEETPAIGNGDKEHSGKVISIDRQEDDISHQIMQEPETPAAASHANEKTDANSIVRDILSTTPSNSVGHGEIGSTQERTLKKTDEILPCPRCHSMNTRFCYYNNHNVKQPRHLCKTCQRYWTVGGSMRYVPVGAGRRKRKTPSASSNYCQLIASEASPTAHLDYASGVHNGTLGNIATALTLGANAPLCNSMSSVLNLAEKTNIKEDQSSGSSITGWSRSSERRKVIPACQKHL